MSNSPASIDCRSSNREEIDLSAVVEKHVERFRARTRNEGIEIVTRFEPNVCVVADAGRVGEVVDNLIDNAIKYTQAGGRVDVSVERAGGTAHLIVFDTGVGFGHREREHLFDRFYSPTSPK